jgi:hypothetical protein
MTINSDSPQSQSIQAEVIDLERRLQDAKARLNGTAVDQNGSAHVPKVPASDGNNWSLLQSGSRH